MSLVSHRTFGVVRSLVTGLCLTTLSALVSPLGATELYSVETIAPPPAHGLLFTDVEFNAEREMVASLFATSRRPCDSYIARVGEDGSISRYAEPCIDAMASIAFHPEQPDRVYIMEHGGYWDYVFTVIDGGDSGDRRLFASNFIVPLDIDFDASGNLYVADIYTGTLYKIATDGANTVFASGFAADRSGYPTLYGHHFKIAIDRNDQLFAAEGKTGTIYQLDRNGNRTPYLDGFAMPTEIAFSHDNAMLVADAGNLYRVSSDRQVELVASEVNLSNFTVAPDGAIYGVSGGAIVKLVRNSVDVDVDIDPDTLNLKSKGRWVTAYITPPLESDAEEIDWQTARLNDTIAAEKGGIEIDGYGNPRLMMKFSRKALIDSGITAGDIELTITGVLPDGSRFEGSDTIRVID